MCKYVIVMWGGVFLITCIECGFGVIGESTGVLCEYSGGIVGIGDSESDGSVGGCCGNE